MYLAAHQYMYEKWGRGKNIISVNARLVMLCEDIHKVYPGPNGEQLPPVEWVHINEDPAHPIEFFGIRPVHGVNYEGIGYGEPLVPADHNDDNLNAIIDIVALGAEEDE